MEQPLPYDFAKTEPRYKLKSIISKKETPLDDIKKMQKNLVVDIKKFHKKQLKVLPVLDGVEFKIANNAEDDVLLLPSDFNILDHKKYGLEKVAATEYKLREGQANDAIAMLCTGIIHGMVLNDSWRKHSRGYINTVAKKKNEHGSSYRQARVDDLPDFPPLKKEDVYSKNAAGARGLGDGAVTDSWIWTYGRLRGMNEGEKQDFLLDWFRAHADTECWMEEVEILEQEFCQYISACKKMEQINDSVAEQYQLQEALVAKPTSGYRVYVAQKASMYQEMQKKAEKDFIACGGGWPDSEDGLCEYVVARRPKLTVDWKAQHEGKATIITAMATTDRVY
ncbi:hypothetical protein EDD85DRAFT_971680 [Armillaria nabsnona]|nr:hypothetical protein EDD85DRAFT_971680 [Armillaria nabsnona]